MRIGLACLMSLPFVLALSTSLHAAVTLTSLGTAYTENFDTLASSGTSSSLPSGWAFSEAGTNANVSYTAGNGTVSPGDTYSFGQVGSFDRALGTIRSEALQSIIGASFENGTGSILTSLAISYTGEQWRLGATTGPQDQLTFQYSLDATSLTTGTWTDVAGLNFTSPVTFGTVGALVGDLNPNRTSISQTFALDGIAAGQTFWIRWNDLDRDSADDGLAIDDFSLTAFSATTVAVPAPDLGGSISGLLAAAGLAVLMRQRRRATQRRATHV